MFDERGNIPHEEHNRLNGKEIWQSEDIFVARPTNPAIPIEEGTHTQIISKQSEGDWRQDDVELIREEGYYALAVARMVAESSQTEDLWANIHWNSSPNYKQGCNVYGRNPLSKSGWAKPVSIRENGADPTETEKNFKRFANIYLQKFKNFRASVQPFRAGIQRLDPTSDEFENEAKSYKEKESPWQETLLWANNRFAVVLVDNPHLSGVHLVVHPRETYWGPRGGFQRPWQMVEAQNGNPDEIEGFLEAVTILKLLQKILSRTDTIPFYNPEIHFSGNWAKDLLPTMSGGKIDRDAHIRAIEEGTLRDEKREFGMKGSDQIRASMHGHLYATKNFQEYVHLPTRPQKEVPEEWAHIEPIGQDEINSIKETVKNQLGVELESLSKKV